MSTTELKRLIDERSIAEQKWMAAYLFDRLRTAPELAQTADELAELARRRDDLLAGRERVTQAEAEARWDRLEKAEP
jgi:hypothetical protein